MTSILPQRLARAFIPTAWSLPSYVIVKKRKPDDEVGFDDELYAYKKLSALQGKEIPVCYGEARCDGTRALVLSDVGGVSLLHRSVLFETSEEQIKKMIMEAYGPMLDQGIAYDDWNPDNFHLVNGKIVILDLEWAGDLDEDNREHIIEFGLIAFMDRWKRARRYFEKYGDEEHEQISS